MRVSSLLMIWLCVLSITGAATAQDEPLPESVTTPYLAYEAAVEAGDETAAAEAAEQAWRAADELELDRAQTAILALNAGTALALIGDYEAAQEAYDRSIALQEAGDHDAFMLGVTYRLKADALLQHGDSRRAFRTAQQALDRLEGEAGESGITQRFQASLVQIQAASSNGQYNRARRIAEHVFEEGLAAFDPLPAAYGVPAFSIAVERASEDDETDAAYWFAVSYALMARIDGPMKLRDAADAWGDFIREDMRPRAREQLLARLAEGGYLLDAETEAGLESVGFDAARPAGFQPAVATRREAPRYPLNAARIGAEGFAVVRYDVDIQGRVQHSEVIYSIPYADFGEASLRALDKWEFEPATQDGLAVPDEGRTVTMQFEMRN